MNQYYRYAQNNEEIEALSLVILVLLIILGVVIIRNWYNLYKKRSFRKRNKKLQKQLNVLHDDLNKREEQTHLLSTLKDELSTKKIEVLELNEDLNDLKQQFYDTLNEKEKEIALQKESLNHQKKAYERYVIFKSVEANNTRLGAHFLKNVISQIYEDLEANESRVINLIGFKFQLPKKVTKLPSIKALKNIFKLLDYNVAALNKETISLEKELEHIHMFLDLISYLKPKAKIELNNKLHQNLKTSLQIKPTLLFPFVENALKHGALNEDHSFISIELTKDQEEQLNYCIINSVEVVAHSSTNKGNNFGLKALQQLIDAYYPGSKMEHKALPNKQYMSQLTLNLNQ